MANAFFSDLLVDHFRARPQPVAPRRPDRRQGGRLRPDRIVRGAAVGRAAKPRARRWRARCSTAITSSTPTAGVAFFEALARDFGPDRAKLAKAIEAWQAQPGDGNGSALHFASEPRRQELIRRLNRAPHGTGDLVAMRSDLLTHMDGRKDLAAVDRDVVASARLVVQQGVSRAAQDRLVDAGEHSRTDHPLRGRARDPRLGRSAPPHRSRRPPLLRLLPSGAGRRAADLRRGGADRDDSRTRSRRCSRSTASRCRSSARAPRCSTRSPTPSAGSAASPSAIS